MTEAVRLSKRLIELVGCSRREAELYIEGGWVSVDGEIVDRPQALVDSANIQLDPNAKAASVPAATLLFNKPPGIEVSVESNAAPLLNASMRAANDNPATRVLSRHFARQMAILPLPGAASGLQPFTQDGRLIFRMREDGHRIEQEINVAVSGQMAPGGLSALSHGMRFKGRVLPPMKVSWQNETQLRFAIKGPQAGQLEWMCAQVGLQVSAIKRIRIGRISLGKINPGEWRYLHAFEEF